MYDLEKEIFFLHLELIMKGDTTRKKVFPNNSTEVNFKFICQNCGEIQNSTEMAEMANVKYRQYCKKCAANQGYRVCPECNKFRTPDRGCSCQDAKPIAPGKFDYNYQANWRTFRRNENDVILFGIEIEIELAGESINTTKEIHKKPWIIYKHDGSLSGRGSGGFELVTMPLGWEWIKDNKEEFQPIFDLNKVGLKSRCTTTCGMHIHISKSVFSTFHLYKFYKFHHDNKDILYLLSGRSWNSINRWATFHLSNDEREENRIMMGYAKSKTSRNRHSAINLMNPESVEIRVFRGTISPKPFWRNIEFVKSVYDYTRFLNPRHIGNRELYLDYVQENKKEYPNLAEFFDNDLKGEILCV